MSAKYKRLSSNPYAVAVLKSCVNQGFTDEQTQQQLIKECGYKWTLDTIKRHRLKMKAASQKTSGASTDTATDEFKLPDSPLLMIPPHGISGTEKAQWFRSQFCKTSMFKTIKRQFEPEEVAIYVEDYGNLCCQFEDIVLSEFFQIDDFLKHRILVDRQLILSRIIQREIGILQDWFVANPKKEDEHKDTIKYRIIQQRTLDDKYRHLKVVNDRYDSLVKERQKIYQNLAATRRDRLDELRGGKETFFALVSALQHSQEERDRQGRLAELTKLAAKDIKNKFRKPIEFPDGQKEPIILDDETCFGDEYDE